MEARGKSKREEKEEKEAKRRRRSVDSEDDKPRRRQKSDSRRSGCQSCALLTFLLCLFFFGKFVRLYLEKESPTSFTVERSYVA